MKIFLLGFMGAGKTTAGKKLATKVSTSFYDIDQFIEKKYDSTVSDIFRKFGEDQFRLWEQEALKELATIDNTVIALGGGTPCFFDNMEFINREGISIYLQLPVSAIINRLKNAKISRPLISGKSDDQLHDYISKLLSEREKYYNKAQITINALDLNIDNLIENVIKKRLP